MDHDFSPDQLFKRNSFSMYTVLDFPGFTLLKIITLTIKFRLT